MKVLIVSGFLGAGKTTFIRHLTDIAAEHRFAIFENEFGQTDIDAKVLGENDSLKVWEMTENCVCCSGKSDFVTSLFTISSAVDPEILIVEPTGVAKLGVLIDNIESLHYDRITMLRSVAIVDINAFLREKDAYDDIYLNQIENAATIVFSKSESLSKEECAPYIEAIKKINPHAEIVCGNYAERPKQWWEELLNKMAGKGPEKSASVQQEPAGKEQGLLQNTEKAPMQTVTLTGYSLPTPVHLMMILDLVVGGLFGDIPRAKGYVNCHTVTEEGKEEWIRFDLVDRQWQMTGFEPQEESALTFIGPSIRTDDLKEYFTVLKTPKINPFFGKRS